MNILFLSTCYPHPSAPVRGTYNYELCEAMRSFARVRVVSPRPWTEVVRSWRRQDRQRKAPRARGAIRSEFPCYFYPPRILRHQYGQWMWRSIRKAGERTATDFSTDWVLSYWAHPDGEAGLEAARAVGAKSAVIVGGSDVLILPKKPRRRACVQRVLTETDAIFTVSEGLRRTVIDLGVDSSRVHTIYQGINQSIFNTGFKSLARQEIGMPVSDRMFLWVGRMVGVKQLALLVEAFRKVQQTEPAARLVLAGDGPLHGETRQAAELAGLSATVHFAGPIPQTELPKWYRAADATVLSSSSEGLPNVFRESLACGTPFVSTDVGSISEIASPESSTLARSGDAEELKTHLHRRMVDAIVLSKAGKMDESELRQQLRALAAHLCTLDEVNLNGEQREQMVREIMDEIYGFGPLEPLMNDPEISDVLVNGPDRVFVERNGRLQQTPIQFADEHHLMRLIHRLVGRAGRRIDEVSPMVDAKLPDGSRLNAVIPPLALKGPTISIRRFRSRALLFEDMVSMGSMAPEMADFLVMAIRGRLNLLVSGGTGAGKTTLLNNLSRFIPVTERVITIEQTAELQLQQPDVVSLEMRPANVEGTGEIDQRDLLKNSLRMRPDRIIVGESRGGEVLEMLQAMNTGHDGSMSTLHANDTRDALDRLEMMIALSGVDLPTQVARQYIASAVQLLVHMTRLSTGERKVTRISELCGCRNGVYIIEDIFVYRWQGVDESCRAIGSFFATGHEPTVLKRLAAAGFDIQANLFDARELKSR